MLSGVWRCLHFLRYSSLRYACVAIVGMWPTKWEGRVKGWSCPVVASSASSKCGLGLKWFCLVGIFLVGFVCALALSLPPSGRQKCVVAWPDVGLFQGALSTESFLTSLSAYIEVLILNLCSRMSQRQSPARVFISFRLPVW